MRVKCKKIIKFVCLCIVAASLLVTTGCGSPPEVNAPENTATLPATPTPSATQNAEVPTPTPQTTPDLSNYAVNPLTGVQDMDKANIGKRSIAVMISNIKPATPQAGITECDIIYELEVEGGITRMMGMFADVNKIPTLGPIRSARDCFVDLALGYNTVYAHFGGSTSAISKIGAQSLNNLDGTYLSNTFWRDQARLNSKGLEHSAMTSGQKLSEAIASKGYKMDTGLTGGQAFEFYPQSQFTADGTRDCTEASAKFSGSYTSVFKYNPTTKTYGKSQFGAPHVDENGKQVETTNVIIIKANIVSETSGYVTVTFSSGKGYCFSGGKCKEIQWSKGNLKNPISYSNLDGTPLKVNAGKTYVCVVRDESRITIS